jgi:hypothetical protein
MDREKNKCLTFRKKNIFGYAKNKINEKREDEMLGFSLLCFQCFVFKFVSCLNSRLHKYP